MKVRLHKGRKLDFKAVSPIKVLGGKTQPTVVMYKTLNNPESYNEISQRMLNEHAEDSHSNSDSLHIIIVI